jgi:hypothetical protein
MNWLAEQLKLEQVDDWYRIKIQNFMYGYTLLTKYEGSIWRILMAGIPMPVISKYHPNILT